MEQLVNQIADRKPHRITLSRHSGEQRTFLIRRCDEKDFDEIMALQRKICDEVADPDIYSLVEEEDVLESLQLDHCFGVYLEDPAEPGDPADPGATRAMVTIGPENTYSLNNLLSEGYEIIDTRPLYEGAMRHILQKDL